MKKIHTILLLLCAPLVAVAQQPMAILNHNDSLSVYYGSSALQQAHVNASGGDVITLSSGVFDNVTLTKPVKVRGAGMYSDTIANTMPSIVQELNINIVDDSMDHLFVEGICCSSTLYYQNASHPQFSKCFIRSVSPKSSFSSMVDAFFTNCVINRYSSKYTSFYSSSSTPNATNTTFVNSAIIDCYNCTNVNFYNCVAGKKMEATSYASNSILYGEWDGYGGFTESTCTHCIGICRSTNSGTNYFSSCSEERHNHDLRPMTSIFVNFTGYDNEITNFELKPSVINNTSLLGDDGTQVGIYGGLMPFDPRVSNPAIVRISVANRSTADGKLAVDIEVAADSDESVNN